MSSWIDRREFLRTGTVVGASVIAGCNGDGDSTATNDATETQRDSGEDTEQASNFYETHPWPMPRGGAGWSRYTPHGNGISPQYEAAWTTTTDNPANGARPLVTQNHLVVLDNGGTVYGLELHSGTVDWDTDLGFTPNQNPLVHEETIVVPGESQVVGLSLEDGSETWQQQVDIPDGNQHRLIWGTAVDGAVFFGVRFTSDLYAVDVADGSIRWQRTTDNWVYNGPVGESGTIVISTHPEGGLQQGVPRLVGYDTESGDQTWAVEQNEDDNETFNRPFISDGVAYSGYNIAEVSSITAVEVNTGDVLVSDIVEPDPTNGPVKAADPEHLYYWGGMGVGHVDKQSLLSGQTPSDTYTQNTSLNGIVAITDNYVYTRRGSAEFHIIDKDGFEQVGTIESNWELTAPVVGGERVYVASQRGEVIAYE